ncbi:hypothetical protein [Marivivens marinus]|uniref:hypothetical protein n=1 Tax=Marivivens marinus TaxID=3110173 RepID=UPI003B84A4AF
MRKVLPNAETLGGFTTILFGASIFAAATASGLPVPPGTAQASFGLGTIIGHLSHRRRFNAEKVIADLRRQIEDDWTNHLPGHADPGQIEAAIRAFDEVLPLIEISSTEVVGRRLDPARMADLFLAKAEAALPDVYRPASRHDADARLARAFLADLTESAYRRLLAMPEFTGSLAPAIWSDLLGQMDRVEDQIATGFEATTGRLDTIEALLRTALATGQQAQTARASGITDAALVALASRVAADVRDPEQAFRELERAVDLAITVQTTPSQDTPALGQAARLSAEGQHDAAGEAIDAALAEAEAAHTARVKALLEAGLQQDLLRRDPDAAATRLFRLATEGAAPGTEFDALSPLWMEWFARGRDKALFLDLEVAGALAGKMAEVARTPVQQGTAANYAGIIQHTLGERRPDMAALHAAVACFEEALAIWDRADNPALWAKAQMNLANSQHAIAQRDPGNDRLNRAIAAYDAALAVRTRDSAASDWAMTQMNLGTALRTLAELEASSDAATESLAAIDAALTVRTRSAGEPGWAVTQLNRAMTLRVRGELQRDIADLQEALSALHEVVPICAEQGLTYYRALADRERGALCADLARLGGQSDLLAEARGFFQRALDGLGTDGAPLDRMVATAMDACVDRIADGADDAERFDLARRGIAERGERLLLRGLDRFAGISAASDAVAPALVSERP